MLRLGSHALGPVMVVVAHAKRKSAVLSPSSLECLSRSATVNLTAGCAHACRYCYAQGYSNYPGDGRVVLYTNTLSRLREELRRKRTTPEAVYFSPSSDLFQPVPDVLEMAYGILELLFDARVGVSFTSKGRIPRRHMELLKANAPLVRAQIGLNTVERRIQRLFEPQAAPPQIRLVQARELVESGIPTQVRLDPILPGLTDAAERLDALFAAVDRAGLRRAAASVLFLRPAIIRSLRRRVHDQDLLRKLLAGFASTTRLASGSGGSRVLTLPTDARREIYDRVTAVARSYGIETCVCGCKNPDLGIRPCGIGGRWPRPDGAARQLALFEKPVLRDNASGARVLRSAVAVPAAAKRNEGELPHPSGGGQKALLKTGRE